MVICKATANNWIDEEEEEDTGPFTRYIRLERNKWRTQRKAWVYSERNPPPVPHVMATYHLHRAPQATWHEVDIQLQTEETFGYGDCVKYEVVEGWSGYYQFDEFDFNEDLFEAEATIWIPPYSHTPTPVF